MFYNNDFKNSKYIQESNIPLGIVKPVTHFQLESKQTSQKQILLYKNSRKLKLSKQKLAELNHPGIYIYTESSQDKTKMDTTAAINTFAFYARLQR